MTPTQAIAAHLQLCDSALRFGFAIRPGKAGVSMPQVFLPQVFLRSGSGRPDDGGYLLATSTVNAFSVQSGPLSNKAHARLPHCTQYWRRDRAGHAASRNGDDVRISLSGIAA